VVPVAGMMAKKRSEIAKKAAAKRWHNRVPMSEARQECMSGPKYPLSRSCFGVGFT
jgi:hypothetical protein